MGGTAILRRPRILMFIDGPTPNKQDIQTVAKMGSVDVAYRNANAIDPTGNLETCDGVAGAVPPSYEHLPNPAEAIKIREKDQAEMLKASGDDKSPSFPNSDKNRPGDGGTAPSKVWGPNSNEKTGETAHAHVKK